MARHMHRRFLMRHAQEHIVTRAVLKAHHLLTDGSISARFLPHFARHDHGKEHFLPVDGVHLLADYFLYFFAHALRGRGERIYARRDLLDIAGAGEQDMAFDARVLRRFLRPLAHEF